MTELRWGRSYFAAQALAGAAWWVAVFAVPLVREATLGGLDPVVVAIFDVPLFVGASALAAFGSRVAAVVATAWTLVVTIGLAAYATFAGEAGWGVLAMTAASVGSIVALALMVLGRVPTEWVLIGPLAFRPAAEHTGSGRHVVATFAQIVVFWGLFLVVIPVTIDVFERRWNLDVGFPEAATPIGIAVLVLASACGIWAAVAMSTRGAGTPLPSAMPNRLVIAGPYRFVRNPMALSGVTQAVGVGLLLSSWLVIVYAIVGGFFWNLVVRPLEEADLEARFGDEFGRYRAAVRCWWPKFDPFVVERSAP